MPKEEEQGSFKREMNWGAMVDSIAHRFITSGFGVPLLAVFGALGALYILSRRLESSDLTSLLEGILASPALLVSGWALFLVCLGVAVIMLKFQKRVYENQIKHLRTSLDEALTYKEPPRELE